MPSHISINSCSGQCEWGLNYKYVVRLPFCNVSHELMMYRQHDYITTKWIDVNSSTAISFIRSTQCLCWHTIFPIFTFCVWQTLTQAKRSRVLFSIHSAVCPSFIHVRRTRPTDFIHRNKTPLENGSETTVYRE